MADHHNIHRLFEKYITDSCFPEEAAEFMHVLRSGDNRDYIERLIEMYFQADHPEIPADDAALTRVFEKLTLSERRKSTRPQLLPLFFKTAAAVLLIVALFATYSYFRPSDHGPMSVKNDAAPGGNRATLTLADGRTIDLSESQTGIVVGEDITYLDGSSVVNGRQQATNEKQLTLTLRTPKGGTYQVTLPDGTKAWLNSASTLTYPSRFNENERVVQLEGEAYFEVRPAANAPFRVVSTGQTVEVLGTNFNVNAYPDEHTVRTTLINGAVRVVTDQNATVLKPGQQSEAGAAGLAVANVDIETIVDWKSGDFVFADESLESIMRKVARWYDVEVVYQDKLPNEGYSAQISRNRNLSEVLHILELSGGLSYTIKNDVVFLSTPN